MKTVTICQREERESTIVCGDGLIESRIAPLRESLLGGGGLIFTDSNVFALYRDMLEEHLGDVPVYVMPAGEQNKNEQTLFALLGQMAKAGLRRNSTLVALGGGVVGDIGGLAAGLYMRGIGLIQIPTTLLAQVDSSVGGKTAVDFCGVKNLIGVFKQPSSVLADPFFLRTLPSREIRCGLGEIVKHGALHAPLFEELLAAGDLFDLEFLARIVPENIAFKADVVRRDPFETGLRKCLNLGHTTGHAIELSSGLSHGECVLWGLIVEGKLASRHLDTDADFLEALFGLCARALMGTRPSSGCDVRHALLDKKNTVRDSVTLTVPVAAGKYELLQLPFARYADEFREIWEGSQ